MAQNASQSLDELEIGTVFSQGVEFEGQITLSQPVLVHGAIKGSIISDSDVFVAPEARIEADIEARRISVKGSVGGTVKARERLELFRSARISGTIEAGDMVVQSGAKIDALCRMSTAIQEE